MKEGGAENFKQIQRSTMLQMNLVSYQPSLFICFSKEGFKASPPSQRPRYAETDRATLHRGLLHLSSSDEFA